MSDLRRLVALVVTALLGVALVACGSSSDAASSSGAAGDGVVKVYLARHGKTMLNTLDRVQGWSDSPLTSDGEAVATKIGEGFGKAGVTFDAAYSADMVRHFSTATLMLKGAKSDLPVTRMPELREASFGGWEGDFNKTMQNEGAKRLGFPSIDEFAKSGRKISDIVDAYKASNPNAALAAEDSKTVADRALAGLERVTKEQSDKGGGSLLVVSSGVTVMVLLERLGATVPGTGIANGAVNHLVYEKGQWRVESINDLSYSK